MFPIYIKKDNNARAHGFVCADKRDSPPITSLEPMINLLRKLGTDCGARQSGLQPYLKIPPSDIILFGEREVAFV